MKKDKMIYWTTTGIISLMMLFSGYMYFQNPTVGEGFKQLGFPDYFRVELGIAKIIAALVLIIPQMPVRVKEWAYAGLGIVFISAAIAHAINGDTPGMGAPMVFLLILFVSNVYLHKVKDVPVKVQHT
ncbi:MAG: DoxX family protein [Chitinophagales bacterium]|nr:DoxX family protein [Chitinophagales bacterium]